VRRFALSAIGQDRPGIVAAITGVLLQHGVNIEDSQATILRGHFSVVLIVAAPDEADAGRLGADVESAGAELGLEAIVLRDVAELTGAPPEASHMVTVYGVDHPGIVHAATSALAERGVDITDLNTRLVEDEGEEPLYALMMEVALPQEIPATELEEALHAVGETEGVEVTLRELDQDAL
jgi:glycine cleavage system transcriptional repressor